MFFGWISETVAEKNILSIKRLNSSKVDSVVGLIRVHSLNAACPSSLVKDVVIQSAKKASCATSSISSLGAWKDINTNAAVLYVPSWTVLNCSK